MQFLNGLVSGGTPRGLLLKYYCLAFFLSFFLVSIAPPALGNFKHSEHREATQNTAFEQIRRTVQLSVMPLYELQLYSHSLKRLKC